MWRLLAVLLMGAATMGAGAAPLTFEQAWGRLLAEDDNLAAGAAAEDSARALADSARALLLPQVELLGTYTRLDRRPELNVLDLEPLDSLAGTSAGQLLVQLLGGPDVFSTPLTDDRDIARSSLLAFWPLYTGGRVHGQRRLLELGRDEAGALREELRRARFLELVGAYFGLVTAEHLVATRQAAADTLAGHLEAARRLEEHAQIARVERLAAQAAYDQARIDLASAREKRDITRLALTRLVHAQTPVTPASPLFVHPLPEDDALEQRLEDHPGLRLLALKEQGARARGDMARGLFHPNLFLYGSYNLHEDDALISELTPDWMVGVGVRFALLDRAGRGGKVRAAEAAVERVRRLRAGARRELAVMLESQYREARRALNEYRTLASQIELGEENLHLRQRAFEEGLGRSLDVVDAQTALSAARTHRQAAAFRYVVALAQVMALTGQVRRFIDYQEQGEQTP
ncbi:TolC family protein [Alloalcanivorax marinus]|uniref:TolC family protein n=1 Tax=Alloalcanivorax marinus TaxID=1177169 RepID=UPI001933A28B|nr:TolC family protein [Alloalcanivorax marinus]MBL7249399.1 TolC family protein [Alloalcanivorax marinus]